jgi:Leucine-rich repeat (LRR) protein
MFSTYRGNLERLPESFGNLSSLEELDFGHSKTVYYPESFGNLKSLKTFNMEKGVEREINEDEKYHPLKSIQKDNSIHLPESFGGLVSLENLDIIGEIAALPKSFGKLRSLKNLSLSFSVYMETYTSNKGARFGSPAYIVNGDEWSFPESFGDLESLESIYISGGNIKRLPESFGNLRALESLTISNTKLEALPDSFGKLRNLEELKISNDEFNLHDEEAPFTFPQTIDGLSKLKNLNINASVHSIPDWLGELKSLESMTIKSKTITKFPDSICELSSLESLFIDCEKLVTLPENFGNLKKLEILVIDGSSFCVLPDSTGNLSSLIRLYMYNTKIKTFPKTVGNLSKLKKIRLLRCAELESLPDTIGNLSSLETLYIRGGKMKTLPESIVNISTLLGLQLQYTSITNLPAETGKLKNLVSLGVFSFHNDMDWGGIDSPPEYTEDETFEKRSPFTCLPDTVSKLTSLKYLRLSNTEITSLPDYLGNLPALERIDIVKCNVANIPPSIQQLVDKGELLLMKTEKEYNRFSWEFHLERQRPRRKQINENSD